MLDMAYIRENGELLQRAADRKGIALSVAELLEQDERRRKLLREVERLRQDRNRLSGLIGGLMKQGAKEEAEQIKQEVQTTNDELGVLEVELTEVEASCRSLMLLVPNPVSADTPEGKSDADNVEVKRVGELPEFEFAPLSHVELGERLGIVDLQRGVKIGGARQYVLKGAGWHLHRAVQQLAMDVLESNGFTPLEVPMMVRGEALLNTGFFPTGEDQVFAIAEEDRYLVGTSEVSLVSYLAGEIVELNDGQPIRLAAATSCFRREIGSSGRDVHGLYRVHQFAKVEQVVVCENDPELSERLLQEITGNAERILQLLELPYRVVAVCAGDMSQKTHKQYDIETWMPSRQAYGETHSASNLLDFQARRANIRYRDEEGKLRYCHTLNNTAVATPRILIPLLENHQRADGSVYVPQALRPYLGGKAELRIGQLER
ncbi:MULTISPECIES: serine--tRNA ligase [Cohnella]|uniref:Serine--tRNA ligase n=1 Tax=Cohnella phaseoli TaxID=456490 RepID=A0A3D9IUR9_9BACL|nr:serine--tRNA ligase [Cohnella phaseoli]RED65397.1 seryl-tRNA synthetase [Cohnella phaseoli]